MSWLAKFGWREREQEEEAERRDGGREKERGVAGHNEAGQEFQEWEANGSCGSEQGACRDVGSWNDGRGYRDRL